MRSQALERVLEIVGNASILARALNVSKATVSIWRRTGTGVPVEYCHAVERLVKGAVTCEEMQPDHDFTRAVGELAETHN